MPSESQNILQDDNNSDPSVVLSGISFREIHLSEREKLAITEDRLPQFYENLRKSSLCDEAVAISTCNRVELIAARPTSNDGRLSEEITEALGHATSLPRDRYQDKMYRLLGKDAVRHVFNVASGLDSMVIGEPQILGQLKSAYRLAHQAGMVRYMLNPLFHRAFAVAKCVRAKTGIGRHAVSIVYAVRELAREVFGDLSDRSAMIFGTGEMGKLSVRHFTAAGVKQFYIVSSTLERSVQIAEAVDGVPLTMGNFQRFLAKADIVIGARTMLPEQNPYLTAEIARASSRIRQAHLFIDLGVPRNFDSDILSLSDAFLYSIDDLQQLVEENVNKRQSEVIRAQSIVDEEVEKFCFLMRKRKATPIIKALRQQFRELASQEHEKISKRLAALDLDEENLAAVEELFSRFSHSLTAKLLHQPTVSLKLEVAENEHAFAVAERLLLNKPARDSN